MRKRGINLGLEVFLDPQLHPWDGVQGLGGGQKSQKEVPKVLRGFLYHILGVLVCLL